MNDMTATLHVCLRLAPGLQLYGVEDSIKCQELYLQDKFDVESLHDYFLLGTFIGQKFEKENQ
jgi:hypothetical protein